MNLHELGLKVRGAFINPACSIFPPGRNRGSVVAGCHHGKMLHIHRLIPHTVVGAAASLAATASCTAPVAVAEEAKKESYMKSNPASD